MALVPSKLANFDTQSTGLAVCLGCHVKTCPPNKLTVAWANSFRISATTMPEGIRSKLTSNEVVAVNWFDIENFRRFSL
jgi:hypothetical protein